MVNKKIIVILVSVLALLIFSYYNSLNSSGNRVLVDNIHQKEVVTKEAQYTEASRLIQMNCADCFGATKEGMLNGIQHIEALVKEGFVPSGTLEMLADAYNQMMIVYAENKAEALKWKEKKVAFLIMSIKQDSLNDSLLEQLADSTDSILERINLYRKAFENNIKNTSAGASLAIDLLQVGKNQEAMEVAKKAIADSEQGATHTFGRLLFFKFRDAGLKEEAKEIKNQVDTIFQERREPKDL